jgi:hypothetical protein
VVLHGSSTKVVPSPSAVVFVSTKKISDVPAAIQGGKVKLLKRKTFPF